MYSTLLIVHSLVRWLVLVAAFIALARAVMGWSGNRQWTPTDDKAGRHFVTVLDIQFLLGLILYGILSPLTTAAFQDFGGAMRDGLLRFWAVEHIAGMIVAVALAHVGRARTRKQTDSAARHRTAAIFFGLSLLVMLASIPWPFMNVGRPLFRF